MSLSEISEAFAASGEGWTEGRRKLQRSLSLQDTGTPQRRGSFTLTMRYGFLMSHIFSPIIYKADRLHSRDNLQEFPDYRHRQISQTDNSHRSHISAVRLSLTLIRFCGVRADPRQIKMVGISQQDMIRQRLILFYNLKFL